MARPNPNFRSALDDLNINENNKSNNEKTNCQECKGSGQRWIILEKGKLVKYVNFFSGKTKIHFDGGLPFLCWPWRTHIQIISYKNLNFSGNFSGMQSKDKDDLSSNGNFNVIYDIINPITFLENQENFFQNLKLQTLAVINQYFESKNAYDIYDTTFEQEVMETEKLKNLEELFGIKFKKIESNGLSPENRDKTIKAQTTAKYEAETKKIEEKANREKIQAETETEIKKLQQKKVLLELLKEVELGTSEIENSKEANKLITYIIAINKTVGENITTEQAIKLATELIRKDPNLNKNLNINDSNINITDNSPNITTSKINK